MVAGERAEVGLQSGWRVRAVWRGRASPMLRQGSLVLGGRACYLRGRASYLRGCPSQGPPTPQGLHISRVPRSILSRGDPRWGDRSILSHVGGSMSQGHSVHPFEAAPIPRARGILEAAYRAQGMHTGPAQGPHLSQWATRNILSGPPIPGVCMPRATQGLPSCTRTAHILAGRAVVGLVAGGIRSTWGPVR